MLAGSLQTGTFRAGTAAIRDAEFAAEGGGDGIKLTVAYAAFGRGQKTVRIGFRADSEHAAFFIIIGAAGIYRFIRDAGAYILQSEGKLERIHVCLRVVNDRPYIIPNKKAQDNGFLAYFTGKRNLHL